MPYCYNCGANIDVKDRKCHECSYPVGHVISIQEEGIYTLKKKSNPLISRIKEVAHYLCEMIKAPVDTIMTISKTTGDEISFGVLVLLLMINGLLFVWVAKLIKVAAKAVTEKARQPGVMEVNPADFGLIASIVDFNYGRVFFNGVILFAIVAALHFIFIHLISKFVFKAKIHLFTSWKISISAFIPYFSGVIAAFILSYFNGVLVLVAFVLGAAASIICLFKALEKELALSSNKVMAVMLCSYGILIIVVAMIIKYEVGVTFSSFVNKQLIRTLFYMYIMN